MNTEVAIVGGGLVGGSLAVALADAPTPPLASLPAPAELDPTTVFDGVAAAAGQQFGGRPAFARRGEQFRAEFASLTLGSGAAAMVMARRELAPDELTESRRVRQLVETSPVDLAGRARHLV